MHAFVLDKDRKPLTPCHMARARILLKQGRAAVLRRFPFTIILKDRMFEESVVHEHRVKVDPGSKVSGMAVVQVETGKVVFAAEIEHRGERIKAALESRGAVRRSRRRRKTRYRQQRSLNRTQPKGRLRPSLESRVFNILTWVAKLRRFCPITAISQELVKFDTKQMEHPEISGVEYLQGTLHGTEIREYLLEKWHRECAYCGKGNTPLQVEHMHPKSRGGTGRISNLTLACEPCNQRKGNRPIEDFLKDKPGLLAKLKQQARAPLKDATAINATRWQLCRRLTATGLPMECGSGGRTKFNRAIQGYPKRHWIDAACVGVSGESVRLDSSQQFLAIKATGHGKRQRCSTDQYGFPKCHICRDKFFLGFQTGDIVHANIPIGKYKGKHEGRITIRHRPKFYLGNFNVHPKYLTKIHRADGYGYSLSCIK